MNTLSLLSETIRMMQRLEQKLIDDCANGRLSIVDEGFVVDTYNRNLIYKNITVHCGLKQILLLFYLQRDGTMCAREFDVACYVWRNAEKNRSTMRSFYRNLNLKLRKAGVNLRITVKSGIVCLLSPCSRDYTHNAQL